MTTSDTSASRPDHRLRLAWPSGPTPPRRRPPVADAEPDDDAPGEGTVVEGAWSARRGVPAALEEIDRSAGSTLRRAIVDAYDRLADRLLQRFRVMHDELGADLTELRSEVLELRHSIDELGDRGQMRQVRSELTDLRADVAKLRRALPDNGPLLDELAGLRASLSSGPGPGPASAVPAGDASGSLVEELRALRDDLRALDAVPGELAELRVELQRMRRRIALRVDEG